MPAPDRKRRLTAFLVAMAVLLATPLAVVAADAFTDVPDTNVFHDDIAWLADAGVTKGCNPPDNTEFCPGDNVTREQMAAFMRRLAQNKVVDAATAGTADHATTADDADTLDGLDSSELTTRVEGMSRDGDAGGNTVTIGPDPSALFTMTVDESHGAYLMAHYGYYANGDSRFFAWVQRNDEVCANGAGEPGTLYFQDLAAGELGTVNGSTVLSTNGMTTLTLCADTFSGTTDVRDAYLNAIYAQDGAVSVDLTGGGTAGEDETP